MPVERSTSFGQAQRGLSKFTAPCGGRVQGHHKKPTDSLVEPLDKKGKKPAVAKLAVSTFAMRGRGEGASG